MADKTGISNKGRMLTFQEVAIDIAFQYHNAGELIKAENIYQQILEVDPNQPVALQHY